MTQTKLLRTSPPAFKKQSGIASMLILLMIGLSLTAAIIGSVYHIRVTQEQSISVHAQTQAQVRAWSAAEVTRQYFQMLRQDATEWETFYTALTAALAAGNPVDINLGMDDVTAKIMRTELLTSRAIEGEMPHIVVQITATAAEDTRAHSSSTLEVMYTGTEPTTGESVPNNSTINFHGGLKMTGGIDVFKDKGDTTAYEINVIGNVDIGSTSITGVDIIRSTGSIKFNGGSSFFKELHANCDIHLSSGASAGLLSATNNICAFNVTYPNGKVNEDVIANGSIHISGSKWGTVTALAGKGDLQKCAVDAERLCDPQVSGVRLSGTPTITTVNSRGDIIVENSATITNMHAEGNISITWGFTLKEKATYGGNFKFPDNGGHLAPENKRQKIPGYTLDLSPALPVNIRKEVFDVNTIKPAANYVFYVDPDKTTLRVTLKNIQGIPNGNYYLFSGKIGNTSFNDWACLVAKPSQASDCVIKIGAGHDPIEKALISYKWDAKTKTGKWTLDGTSLAPGIAFFEGDLTISTGTYYNTMLATGNVDTAGKMDMYAPNFAGYNGQQKGKTYAPTGICVNKHFPNVVPTQLCKNGEYLYNAVNGIANYAVMAGSCTDNTCDTYQGGDIKTGASTDIRGAVKAGNLFVSSGNTTVHGYITALAQREILKHSIGAKTTVDLRDLPPGYDPTGSSTVPGAGEAGASGSMDIRWSRYL